MCDHDTESSLGTLEKLRRELQKETKSRVFKLWTFIMVCACLDVVIAAAFAQSSHNSMSNWYKIDHFTLRVLDIHNDTLDCSVSVLLRWMVILLVTKIIIKYGHPDRYRDPSSLTSKYVQLILSFWKNNFMHSTQTKLIFRQTDIDYLQQAYDEQIQSRTIIGCGDLLHRYQLYNQYHISNFIKETLWLPTVIIACIFQAFIAIKLIFYHNITGNFVLQINATLCIVLGRLELYLFRKYIKYSLETYYKYRNYELHEHPLKSTCNPGAWCDICWGRHYTDSYRCELGCDFDICPECWKKSTKAKLAAENQLRNDNGDIYQKKYIHVLEYMYKLLMMYWKHKRVFLIAVISMLSLSFISLYMPDYHGKLIDYIFNKDFDLFYKSVKTYILISFIYIFFKFVSNYMFHRVSFNVQSSLQKTMFERLMKQDMVYHEGTSGQHRSDVLNEYTKLMFEPFTKILCNLLENIIDGFGGIIMCYCISWRLTLIALCAIGPLDYIAEICRYWHSFVYNKTWSLKLDIHNVSHEGFENIKTIRAFAKENLFIKCYKDVQDEIYSRDKANLTYESIHTTIKSWFDIISVLLIIWSAGMIIFYNDDKNELDDAFTLGSLITFQLCWHKFTEFKHRMNDAIQDLDEACINAQEVFAVLKFDGSIEPTWSKINVTNGMQVKCFGDITFNDVCYSYQMSPNKKVLNGVTFTIPKGKITAIVGRSGAGKTTLINLILRLYDVTSGEIIMNGINIKDFDVYAWRKHIAIVTQDTELFNKTIADNVGFGHNNGNKYDFNELVSSCKLANAHEFIQNLENKYLSKCGNKGVRLSGGQKQRLSIARMLMSKPNLMILDEATSNLDSESESLVQQSLDNLMKNNNKCTIVVIAHRLSTIFNADQIIVMDNGKIVQFGKHTDLIQNSDGIYANLIRKQTNISCNTQTKNDISLSA